MNGTDIRTGKRIAGADHLRQSIFDILTTAVGTRVLRRDYGSLLPSLLDNPQDEATRMRIVRETAGALARHEPRLQLLRVAVRYGGPGVFTVIIDGREKQSGEKFIQEVAFSDRNRPY